MRVRGRGRVRVRGRNRVGVGVGATVGVDEVVVPYISPISPLYLP